MWGAETEDEATLGVLGSYSQMYSNDAAEDQIDEEEDPTPKPGVGQELLLPTVARYGLVNRYKRKFLKSVSKRRIESEDTLLNHLGEKDNDSKYDLNKAKSDLELFFRNTGNVNFGSLKSSESQKAIEEIIRTEFPIHKTEIPHISDLIHIGEQEKNKGIYIPGDWVEIEGNDMIWRLDMVTRSIKQAPDDWDWNDPRNEGREPEWAFSYNAGLARNIKEEDVRSPEAGLKFIFGSRPWVWQQWAILKVEEKLRFQEGHQNDFHTKDIQKLTADLWEDWLNHESNAEFFQLFYDDRIGEKGRVQLMDHIQKPFQLMDEMGEDNHEWDFSDDRGINVFTYVSLLGSGLIIPVLVLAMQLAIPSLLIADTVGDDDRCMNGDDLPPELFRTKLMVLVILGYYLYSITPDTYYNFFIVAGAGDSIYSRLLSLRRLVWMQGDDTLLQMIGFKVDIYMNTSYQSILMMLNIYVILFADDTISVVLDALAFIFIAQIDEEVAHSGWYDKKFRWLTAGAMEAAMQSVIRLRILSSPTLFSQQFGIHEELLLNICNGDKNLLFNSSVAAIDAKDPMYMNSVEQINLICSEVAHSTRNKNALEEYHKSPVHFGVFESVLAKLFGSSYAYPVFERFTPYRTWSRWDKLLFLSPVPTLDDMFMNNDITFKGENDIPSQTRTYPNLYPYESKSSGTRKFLRHIRDVLLFRDLLPSLRPVYHIKYTISFIFRLIDGIFLNWTTYFLQIVFPFYVLATFGSVIYNITYMKCFNPVDYVIIKAMKWFNNDDGGDYY